MTTATPTAAQQANPATGEIPAPAPQAAESELDRLLRAEYRPFSTRDLIDDDEMLDKVLRLAEVMASSRITCPKHLQGNVGDCAAVIGQAMRWGMDHNAVAQKTHLVNGALGYEAQLIIAVLNNSRALATRLDFEWFGAWNGIDGKADKSADRGVRVWATMRGEEKSRLLEVTMAQVGTVRNSPNWAADPRQQIAYLAAKRWGRLHAPDVILGVYTPDELEDAAAGGSSRSASNAPPRNAPAAVVAQHAAPRAERTEHHEKLIEQLEMVAFENGFEAFKTAWGKLAKDDRTAIGLGERDRIGAIGTETDAKMRAIAEADAKAEAGGAPAESSGAAQ